MKWFKHFSSARFDTKIQRLIKRYGLEGYGLYFMVVESVAFQLETNSPVPDLEDTAQDIAEFAGGDTVKIQEIIEFCLEQKLFEYDHDTGRIICLKLLTHLDNTMSTNPEIKKILSNFKKLKETSSNLKQIRVEKIREDKNRKDIVYSNEFFKIDKDYYLTLKTSFDNIDIDNEFKKMTAWCASNPDKVKGRKQWKRFINSWLNRAKPSPEKKKSLKRGVDYEIIEDEDLTPDEIRERVKNAQ